MEKEEYWTMRPVLAFDEPLGSDHFWPACLVSMNLTVTKMHSSVARCLFTQGWKCMSWCVRSIPGNVYMKCMYPDARWFWHILTYSDMGSVRGRFNPLWTAHSTTYHYLAAKEWLFWSWIPSIPMEVWTAGWPAARFCFRQHILTWPMPSSHIQSLVFDASLLFRYSIWGRHAKHMLFGLTFIARRLNFVTLEISRNHFWSCVQIIL